MKIWLDDVRDPPNDSYTVCRSVQMAAYKIMEHELWSASYGDDDPITMIDLDHDLGEYEAMGGDGIKLLDWMVQRGSFYPVRLHTANPVGRKNMERTIRRYWPEGSYNLA